ncbi:hypothetical protein ABKV19_003618 [Rosa sericea]
MDNLLCSSPASTAIMHQRSIVRRGHRLLIEDTDTINPPPHCIRDHDGRGKNQPLCHIPCSSDQLSIHPKSFYEKCRRSFSRQSSSSDHHQLSRKSSADIHELRKSTSSRYLLREDPSFPFIDMISKEADLHFQDFALVPAAEPSTPRRPMISNIGRCNSPNTLRSKSTRSHHQVVVLRVSLHCKGCERKLRKHLSKMEGVTSFSIDLPTKKVTVIGDVTPLGVLTSVSKVKNAQLWPSTTYSPSTPSSQWSAG